MRGRDGATPASSSKDEAASPNPGGFWKCRSETLIATYIRRRSRRAMLTIAGVDQWSTCSIFRCPLADVENSSGATGYGSRVANAAGPRSRQRRRAACPRQLLVIAGATSRCRCWRWGTVRGRRSRPARSARPACRPRSSAIDGPSRRWRGWRTRRHRGGPPCRLARTVPTILRAASTSNSSPTITAHAVVDQLEAVEVQEQHGEAGFAVTACGCHRMPQAFQQAGAVGQAGQCIVACLVRFALGAHALADLLP